MLSVSVSSLLMILPSTIIGSLCLFFYSRCQFTNSSLYQIIISVYIPNFIFINLEDKEQGRKYNRF